jgi:acetate---CoA ligase (ADP-forming)
MNALPPLATAQSLTRMLRPRTIAAIGGHAAAEVLRQNSKIGFEGEVWLVHPHAASTPARRVFRTIADLPSRPDVAFVGVNRHATIDIVAQLAAAGAGGAVTFASGFAEHGAEGQALQTRLSAAANGMPFFGPNCYGFLNYFDSVAVWPDQHGARTVKSGVAIITQSGNIGLNLTMQARALPIGYLITLGNQATVGHEAAMEAVLDDPRVTAIGLHLEGIGNPAAVAAAVARARARNVPVVALKTGRSAAGAHIAQSHTASLASSDTVVDAFFRRIGVARVDTIPALLETLKLLHMHGALPGRRISSLSCSGGEAALIADAAVAASLPFVELSAEARADIAATLPDLVTVSNPLDYHTFGWRNRAALAATFAAMMRAGADMNLLLLDFPRPDRCDTTDWDIAADALGDALAHTGARAAIVATLPETMPETHANALVARGIVPLFGLGEALAAIIAAASVATANAEAPAFENSPEISTGPVTFSEWDGKLLMASSGVPVPAGEIVRTASDAVAAAQRLSLPVAVKSVGAALAHKTELGAVRLNLTSDDEIRAAATALLSITGELLVEQMITGAVAEVIVGVARDSVLGLYLLLGSGGVLAELAGDVATLMLPAPRSEIAAALSDLRVARLLQGFRGAPPGDMEACIDAIMAVQQFALQHRNTLHELEINPLIVRRNGLGAVAADVLLRMAGTPENA